ncbi:MAG: phage baseplate upper protein [Actinomycetota bacterium]|nr:phage baseplate upper protein [Actinomycetota bacterium]
MSDLTLGPFVAGEIPPPVVVEFRTRNADGTTGPPIDITGYAVRYIYKERGATAAIERTGALEDAVNGKARYVWVEADLTTSGNYEAEMWVGNLTNRYASQLIRYHVRPNLGVVPAI